MDILNLIITLALVGGTLTLVLYPLWRQTRSDTSFRINRAGRTLEEYEARYQAALAAIKDLMFDYEMGKVAPEDYEPLLAKSKLEAARIRQQIDRFCDEIEPEIDPALNVEIEALVTQLKNDKVNQTLRGEVDAEIETLKHMPQNSAACPNCGKPFPVGDAFCSGCGQSLAGVISPTATCRECGAPIQPDDVFCAQCGVAVDSKLAMRNSSNPQTVNHS